MNLQNQIRYLNEILNIDMFDDCSVPEGLNMERVRGAIVMRCGLLTPLFSEPEVQRTATQQFFFENQWNFQHIINILKAEYSPIENVAEWRDESQTGENVHTTERSRVETERHEGSDIRNVSEDNVIVDAESGTTQNAESGTTRNAESGTTRTAESGTTQDAEGGATTVTHEVSAENATTYQSDRKETTNHGKTDTITHGKTDTVTHGKTDTVTHGKTDTTTHGKTDTTTEDKRVVDEFAHGEKITNNDTETTRTSDSGDRGLTMHRHGNVGVTTNQQMINEELDLLERFNPYRFIADLYEKELILGLY